MIQVPTYEEFEALKVELDEVKETLRYLIASQPDFLIINQAAKALNVSRATDYSLTKRGKLTPLLPEQ
ncbi:hypothetical protein GCM10028805_54460 [Spirosoma harenae]